jgi:glycerol dehydrogenase
MCASRPEPTRPAAPKGVMELFDRDLAVFGAPGRYVQGVGALQVVGDCARTLADSAVLVIDAVMDPVVGPALRDSCAAARVALEVLPFDGHLGPDTASALAVRAPAGAGVVLAVGGGRAIDAGKALAERLTLPIITVPTVASNDAPTSKNFVLYDRAHRLLEVRHLDRSPDYVIVDTAVLSTAPQSFFRAGLGDAIAKKFEAEACAAAGGATMFMGRSTRLAQVVARACYDTLIAHGAAACAVAGQGRVTPDFDAAVEAMILMAGLGFESGGLSLPHALTRGLSLIEGAKSAPHGLQVAWALQVHFAALGQTMPAELDRLYSATRMPRRLTDLGAPPLDDAAIHAMVEATLPVRHMANLPYPMTAANLVAAIRAVEAASKPSTHETDEAQTT